MIDIGEPIRKEYSEEEKRILKRNFFVTLHGFLFLYLALHNLLIPLAANLFKGQVLWDNVHFWFLVHLPIHFWLRKTQLSLGPYLFLLTGSLTRLGMESFLAPKLASWMMLSVFLSEIATLIFLFFYYGEVEKKTKGFFVWPLSGILLAGGGVIGEMTIRPEYSGSKKREEREVKSYGCQGSQNHVRFPLYAEKKHQSIDIRDCGFVLDEVYVDRKLQIINRYGSQLNLRIYEAKWSVGRLSWKFKRLLQVPVNGEVSLSEYVDLERPVIIKIPDRKNLGHLLVLPVDSSMHFPKGELELTYDTLKWTNHE